MKIKYIENNDNKESLTPNLKKFCAKHAEIAALYVFGSTATGTNRKKSDIDLAVLVKGAMSAMKRIELETAFSNILQRDVDLVIFDKGSPLLQHQVLAHGRLVYEADPKERVRQEVFARKAYFDTAFLYRKIKNIKSTSSEKTERNSVHG